MTVKQITKDMTLKELERFWAGWTDSARGLDPLEIDQAYLYGYSSEYAFSQTPVVNEETDYETVSHGW